MIPALLLRGGARDPRARSRFRTVSGIRKGAAMIRKGAAMLLLHHVLRLHPELGRLASLTLYGPDGETSLITQLHHGDTIIIIITMDSDTGYEPRRAARGRAVGTAWIRSGPGGCLQTSRFLSRNSGSEFLPLSSTRVLSFRRYLHRRRAFKLCTRKHDSPTDSELK
jgi:hypothetical protein